MKCPLCNGTGNADNTPGYQVKLWRLEAGLSQAELAEKAGLSRNGIASIERGGNVTLKSLKAIATALGLKLEVRIENNELIPEAA